MRECACVCVRGCACEQDMGLFLSLSCTHCISWSVSQRFTHTRTSTLFQDIQKTLATLRQEYTQVKNDLNTLEGEHEDTAGDVTKCQQDVRRVGQDVSAVTSNIGKLHTGECGGELCVRACTCVCTSRTCCVSSRISP